MPQAPVHTDSLTVYQTDLKIIVTEEGEGHEIRRPIVRAEKVVEQRISHFFMGLGIIGTMTGPLLIVLHTMPRALFAGVFFVVGVSHLPGPLSIYVNDCVVGINRKQRHHTEASLPLHRASIHSDRRAITPHQKKKDMALPYLPNPRCGIHSCHFANNSRHWISCYLLPPYSFPLELDAKTVLGERTGSHGRFDCNE